MGEIKEVMLVAEHWVVYKIKLREAQLCLLAAFYAYNMKYPKELGNFYIFLEILFLDQQIKKLPSVLTRLFIQLSNV